MSWAHVKDIRGHYVNHHQMAEDQIPPLQNTEEAKYFAANGFYRSQISNFPEWKWLWKLLNSDEAIFNIVDDMLKMIKRNSKFIFYNIRCRIRN